MDLQAVVQRCCASGSGSAGGDGGELDCVVMESALNESEMEDIPLELAVSFNGALFLWNDCSQTLSILHDGIRERYKCSQADSNSRRRPILRPVRSSHHRVGSPWPVPVFSLLPLKLHIVGLATVLSSKADYFAAVYLSTGHVETVSLYLSLYRPESIALPTANKASKVETVMRQVRTKCMPRLSQAHDMLVQRCVIVCLHYIAMNDQLVFAKVHAQLKPCPLGGSFRECRQRQHHASEEHQRSRLAQIESSLAGVLAKQDTLMTEKAKLLDQIQSNTSKAEFVIEAADSLSSILSRAEEQHGRDLLALSKQLRALTSACNRMKRQVAHTVTASTDQQPKPNGTAWTRDSLRNDNWLALETHEVKQALFTSCVGRCRKSPGLSGRFVCQLMYRRFLSSLDVGTAKCRTSFIVSSSYNKSSTRSRQ
ncbi:uncharacterized protein MONBRDRAFT_37017 [Monosiga brevicollis MX1]|uniref:Uncharacterized protein n=1 Tax=Monosiga brevicollis TaxID=81824 RepID=A9UZ22_MONBE|nr:uncharacterized protein MONBRDRAFT_37017 [Monosiga brevicollis MX1]EDQ89709.1 predicted protein [Monosiga brevicollis MX1]|eukprot:XP_001745738.1 hypothetical protein [Monosiga brevicollis MX1]